MEYKKSNIKWFQKIQFAIVFDAFENWLESDTVIRITIMHELAKNIYTHRRNLFDYEIIII